MKKLEKLLNAIREGNNIDLLKSVVSDVNSYDGSLENLEYNWNDDDFFECYFNDKMEVARAVCYGEYNYTDDMVKFDGYGNLKSVSQFEYEAELKDNADEIATEFERLVNDGDLSVDDYDRFINDDDDDDDSDDEGCE